MGPHGLVAAALLPEKGLEFNLDCGSPPTSAWPVAVVPATPPLARFLPQGESSDDLLLLLLRDGCRRDAVRLFQEEYGVGLFEADQAITDLAREHGVPLRSPWSTVSVLLATAALAAGFAFFITR